MVTFQPNNMGQLYVEWSINSKIYVSACLVGRQTCCTNSTLWSGGQVDDVVAVDGDDGDDDQEDIAGAF